MKSVVATDQEALEAILFFHIKPGPRILDVTYNTGKIWRGMKVRPDTNDYSQLYNTDYHLDFRDLWPIENGEYDVVVFDPPHIPSDTNSDIYELQYGVTRKDPERAGLNISGLFEPFLDEARRILDINGIVAAKLCDIIHSSRYQWQSGLFINAALAKGWELVDIIIKARKPGPANWKSRHHVHRAHSYWIVVRNIPYAHNNQ